MSQNKHFCENNREVLYGFDAPTGGFFWTEFYTEDEYKLTGQEAMRAVNGLTLTELLRDLEREFFTPSLNMKKKLIHQYTQAPRPTPLQIKIGKMFGKNIITLLKAVDADMTKNHLGID